MKPLYLTFLMPALAAVEVPLDFTIQTGSQANLTYRVGTILTATHQTASNQDIHNAVVSYSGNILATAEVNPSNGQFEEIRFTGGSIATSNAFAALQVSVGIVPYQITFRTTGLTRTTSSNSVEVLNNGNLNGNIHFTTLTGGVLEVSNFNANNSAAGIVTESVNFATGSSDLISGASLFPAGAGAASVGSTQTSSGLFTKTFSATLFSLIRVPTLSPDAPIQAAGLPLGQSFKQRYVEVGTLAASTNFSLPTAFGQWAIDNELTLTSGQEKNNADYPYALLFALGLPSEASSLPITFDTNGEPIAQLALPASGLGFSLQVQYSPDLQTAFTPLSASYLPGTNPIPKGTTGTVPITFPPLEKGFLRFAVNL